LLSCTLFFELSKQEVTKRCRLSWLTNSVLVYEPKCGGGVGVAGSQPMSTAVLYTVAQINFGDLTPYLTHVSKYCMPHEAILSHNMKNLNRICVHSR
jgi:hypothetical protein